MLHGRGLTNRQGSSTRRELELKMRKKSKVSTDRDEDTLGSRRKRDHQPIPPNGRYTLAPLWSLYIGVAWPLLPETNRVHGLDSLVSLPCKPAPSLLPSLTIWFIAVGCWV